MSEWDSDDLAHIRREFARKEAEKRAQELGVPLVDLTKFKPEPEALAMITRALSVQYGVLPLKKQENVLFYALSDPGDVQASDALRLASRCTIKPVLGLREEILEAIARYYPQEASAPLASTAAAKTPTPNEIRFYYEWEAYGCFSNYARVGFELDGAWWPSSEHYYHLQKFAYVPDAPEQSNHLHDIRKRIYQAITPGDAHKIAKDNQALVRSDWQWKRDDVMRRAVWRKFESNPALAAVLLGTGEAVLIENSPRDSYFGIGEEGCGLHMLGKILMEVRETLRGR